MSGSFGVNGGGMDDVYRPLPSVYLGFLSIWFLSAFSWTFNTWNNRHYQSNNHLQWTLASVPLIKVLQLTLSFLFWYSCYNFQTCSLWMSFGVYVTGALFQTVSFVSFLLISHGYCIMCERLSVPERRTTAALGCVCYLTLVGYRASVPYFTVLLILNYFISFYVIFHHISQNLLVLREQLSSIEDEDIHTMHNAVYTKYTMFKKFQSAMQIVAMAETVIYINMDDTSDNYWLRVLVREWSQLCIFLYIGWTFRSQEFSSNFSVVPNLKFKGENRMPPIYSIIRVFRYIFVAMVSFSVMQAILRGVRTSIVTLFSIDSEAGSHLTEDEMDAAAFRNFSSHEWHIGVQTSSPPNAERSADSFLVIVQHPHAHKATTGSKINHT